MEHPRIFWTYILLLGLVLLWKLLMRKRVYLDKYEYLDAMSFTEWKEGRVIRKELEKRHKGWISIGEFYINMTSLEGEDLVERKVTPEDFVEDDGEVIPIKRHEFRRRPGGIRRRDTSPANTVMSPLVPESS